MKIYLLRLGCHPTSCTYPYQSRAEIDSAEPNFFNGPLAPRLLVQMKSLLTRNLSSLLYLLRPTHNLIKQNTREERVSVDVQKFHPSSKAMMPLHPALNPNEGAAARVGAPTGQRRDCCYHTVRRSQLWGDCNGSLNWALNACSTFLWNSKHYA